MQRYTMQVKRLLPHLRRDLTGSGLQPLRVRSGLHSVTGQWRATDRRITF
jgi:hypothetical protein